MLNLNHSHRDIVRFKNQAESMQRRAKAFMEKNEERVGHAVTALEVSGVSFLFGLTQGKFGGISIVGVPVDLLSGLALHVMAFAGLGGKNSHHLHAFGDGALASYMNGLGRQVGRSIQTPEDRARIARSGVSGDVTGGASMADEELARMVRAGQ